MHHCMIRPCSMLGRSRRPWGRPSRVRRALLTGSASLGAMHGTASGSERAVPEAPLRSGLLFGSASNDVAGQNPAPQAGGLVSPIRDLNSAPAAQRFGAFVCNVAARCSARLVACQPINIRRNMVARRRNRVAKPDPSKEGPVSKETGLCRQGSPPQSPTSDRWCRMRCAELSPLSRVAGVWSGYSS